MFVTSTVLTTIRSIDLSVLYVMYQARGRVFYPISKHREVEKFKANLKFTNSFFIIKITFPNLLHVSNFLLFSLHLLLVSLRTFCKRSLENKTQFYIKNLFLKPAEMNNAGKSLYSIHMEEWHNRRISQLLD